MNIGKKMKDLEFLVEELVENKDEKNSRIAIFEYVRDIPYYAQPNQDPLKALEENKANCGQKARLIKKMLEEIDIEVKKISARYKIDKLPIPKSLKDSHPLGIDYHLATLTKIDGNWILLDATADKGLKEAGFVVNEWEGYSETKWFVEPEMTTYRGKGNKEEFIKKRDRWLEKTKFHKGDLKEFADRFNDYLERVRR